MNDETTTVIEWPELLCAQMDADLRANAYGGINEVHAWLADQGFTVPRAAVYQYALTLRSMDAAAGNIPALMLEHTRRGRHERAANGRDLAGPAAEIVEQLLAWGARQVGLFGSMAPQPVL